MTSKSGLLSGLRAVPGVAPNRRPETCRHSLSPTVVCVLALASLTTAFFANPAAAQTEEPPLSIFGFFQPQYSHDIEADDTASAGSFVLQQLNVFLQKDLSRSWRSLVNLEFVNSYSSSRRTGSFSVEEAWARYRKSSRFNLKLGLHVPTFNHLNEIKNRLPLLPYITRPIAYETSLGEVIPVDQFAPAQAFVSAFGFFSGERVNVDYSVYLGNSPNVATIDSEERVSGVDTTATFLVGGRIGLRRGTLKAGVSSTLDFVDPPFLEALRPVFESISPAPDASHRVRLGADLSYSRQKLYVESEITDVMYQDLPPGLEIGLDFLHVLVGYDFSERWGGYGMLSNLGQQFGVAGILVNLDVNTLSPGVVFHANDRLSVKGQYHFIKIRITDENDATSHRLSTAVSVFF